MNFSFDQETHTYRINDRVVPSVTQILTEIFGRRYWYDDWYAQRGRANHLAIHYYVEGCLDENSVDDRISGYLKGFKKFLAETKFKVIKSEDVLFSRLYNFAGTPDLLLSDNNEGLIISDIKALVEAIAEIQLGGYSILYRVNKINAKRFCIIELSNNGNYDLHWIKNVKNAERTFLACLSIYNFKANNKLTKENNDEQ